MARLLKVDGWQQGLVDIGAIVNGGLRKIPFNGGKKAFMGLSGAIWCVSKSLNTTINLRAEEKSLRLFLL